MKAAVLKNEREIKYQEFKKPQVKPDEVLIRVRKTGICGSDLPRVLSDAAHFYPLILGHEFSGEVVEVGEKVKQVSPGDRVSGAPLIPCHECVECQQGNFAQCEDYSFIGSRRHGSWAEYVSIPAVNSVVLPEEVSYKQGAFFEPVTVGLHALELMNFRPGREVAVVGVGTIGLLALQLAAIYGARKITAFDVEDSSLEAAKEYGAEVCINTGDSDFRKKVSDVTAGRGFDQVIECAGVEFTEKLSLELAGNKGQVMFIGTPTQKISLTVEEFEHINRKELAVRGSWMSYSAPFPGKEWDLTTQYFKEKRIRVDRLIDHTTSLSDIDSVFRDIEAGEVGGKVLLEP